MKETNIVDPSLDAASYADFVSLIKHEIYSGNLQQLVGEIYGYITFSSSVNVNINTFSPDFSIVV